MINLFDKLSFNVDCLNLKPILQPMTSYTSVQTERKHYSDKFPMPYLLLLDHLWIETYLTKYSNNIYYSEFAQFNLARISLTIAGFE